MNSSTNLGLALYETTDKFKITDATSGLNKNMEKIDDAFGEIAQDMAPIVRGKQCAVSVAIGKYVLLMDSTITGKTDGAYKAAKAIPANTDIDGTYLTAVADGIANDLTDQIVTVNGKIPAVKLVSGTATCGNAVAKFPGNSGQSLGIGTISFSSEIPTGHSLLALIPSQATRNDGIDVAYAIVPDNDSQSIRIYGTPNATYTVVARMLYK
jgi:hypothetical protein